MATGAMTGREAIDRVKARLDIVETVRRYVPELQHGGRSFKARCPFHTERTPSFIADPQRQSWHCFGACAAGGDVIEFIRRMEGLDFRGALDRAARLAGVELRPPSPRERRRREERERLLSANETAALFFQVQLEGPDGVSARAYATARGLDPDARREWQLGYAPSSWRALTDHLRARGYTDGELTSAGLALTGEQPSQARGAAHDRFRGRLIFPIRDARGQLTGFGARALEESQQPKYLNTPRTPLFDKSATLYGLDRAASEARRLGQLILVEGYLDVIACWQVGIRHVAAAMGTALTPRQLRAAGRLTPHLVLALDADSAGAEATRRTADLAGATGHDHLPALDWRGIVSYQDVIRSDIRIAALPAGEDPDSLARTNPRELQARIATARPIAEHLFAVTAATDLEDPRDRSRAIEALAPLVAAMTDPVVRAHWLQRLARLGRISVTEAQAIVARARAPRRPQALPPPLEGDAAARSSVDSGAQDERLLLALLVQHPEGHVAASALDGDGFELAEHRLLLETLREQLESPDTAADEHADDDEEEEPQPDRPLRALREALLQHPLPEAYRALPCEQLTALLNDLMSGLRRRRRWERLAEAAQTAAQERDERWEAISDQQRELWRLWRLPT